MLFVPDAQVFWIPFAYAAGRRELAVRSPSVILATIGPYSSGVIAYLLSRRTRTPYVLDFRDGWTDDPYLKVETPVHAYIHRRLERLVVTRADAIVVYGDWLRDCFARRYPNIADQVHVIPNGYDPDDLVGIQPAPRDDELYRIVYSGTLYSSRRNNFVTFLDALQALPDDLRHQIDVVVVGQTYESFAEDVERAGMGGHVRFCGYVPHSQALSLLLSADALLLFLPTGDISSLTGKVFEYMMTRKPIIACVEPMGAASDLLRKAGYGEYVANPADPVEIAGVLERAISPTVPACSLNIERYSRRAQAAILANVLSEVASV